LAKEKTATTTLPPPTSHSTVEAIVSALSELETELDGLYGRVDEMKRRIVAHSNEEIDKLRQQVTLIANEEAKKIVEKAKAEADAESADITKQSEKSLAGIKKNIDSSFDKAVDNIVKTVLGESPPTPAQKSEKPAPRAKKYAEQG
jgi:V/A-type H+/Na+-transporting ATPase subunit G/H